MKMIQSGSPDTEGEHPNPPPPPQSDLLKKRKQQQGRGVQFNVVEEFHYRVPKLTRKDREKLWYSNDEAKELCEYEWKKLKKADCQTNNKKRRSRRYTSWRGLEHMRSGGKRRGGPKFDRDEHIQKVCDSILDQYDALRDAQEKEEEEEEEMEKEAEEEPATLHNEGTKDDLLGSIIRIKSKGRTASDTTKYDKTAEALRVSAQALTKRDSSLALKYGLKDEAIAKHLHNNKRQHKKHRSTRNTKPGKGHMDSALVPMDHVQKKKNKKKRKKRKKNQYNSVDDSLFWMFTEDLWNDSQRWTNRPDTTTANNNDNCNLPGGSQLIEFYKSLQQLALCATQTASSCEALDSHRHASAPFVGMSGCKSPDTLDSSLLLGDNAFRYY